MRVHQRAIRPSDLYAMWCKGALVSHHYDEDFSVTTTYRRGGGVLLAGLERDVNSLNVRLRVGRLLLHGASHCGGWLSANLPATP